MAEASMFSFLLKTFKRKTQHISHTFCQLKIYCAQSFVHQREIHTYVLKSLFHTHPQSTFIHKETRLSGLNCIPSGYLSSLFFAFVQRNKSQICQRSDKHEIELFSPSTCLVTIVTESLGKCTGLLCFPYTPAKKNIEKLMLEVVTFLQKMFCLRQYGHTGIDYTTYFNVSICLSIICHLTCQELSAEIHFPVHYQQKIKKSLMVAE